MTRADNFEVYCAVYIEKNKNVTVIVRENWLMASISIEKIELKVIFI